MSQNKNYGWDTFKIFLSTGPKDIYNDNLTRSPAYHSPGLGQEGSKRAWMGWKWPKIRKICPKTRIIGEIHSRFCLVQALGTYTMTIWPGPQLSIAQAWVEGAQKGPEWAQNDQKLAKYVPKLELLVRYFQDSFLVQTLGVYTTTFWSDPQFSIARAWVRGLKKGLNGLKMNKN